MPFSLRITPLTLLVVLVAFLGFGSGCSKEKEPLVIYSGKGLKYPMEEIKQDFERQHGIPVTIIYAGSNTLLTTIQRTQRGDIFVPGSQAYIKKAGELIITDHYVAQHVPTFAVRSDNNKNFSAYSDLLAPGVRIAMGNKDMAAIGRVGEAILQDASTEESFRPNIVVTGSTVNELLQLVAAGEVDAALVWTDMLRWSMAKGLTSITIPDHLNKSKEIRVGVLSTSLTPERAKLFADFMAAEGQAIFTQHGFGKK